MVAGQPSKASLASRSLTARRLVVPFFKARLSGALPPGRESRSWRPVVSPSWVGTPNETVGIALWDRIWKTGLTGTWRLHTYNTRHSPVRYFPTDPVPCGVMHRANGFPPPPSPGPLPLERVSIQSPMRIPASFNGRAADADSRTAGCIVHRLATPCGGDWLGKASNLTDWTRVPSSAPGELFGLNPVIPYFLPPPPTRTSTGCS